MNPRLTPAQIEEILAAAEHVDVPAEQLVAAAAEIRAALLAASNDALVVPVVPVAPGVLVGLSVDGLSVSGGAGARQVGDVQRTRIVRTALVAAALSLATLLTAAIGGALPETIQDPIARVAEVLGIDLPHPGPNPEPAVDTSRSASEIDAAGRGPTSREAASTGARSTPDGSTPGADEPSSDATPDDGAGRTPGTTASGVSDHAETPVPTTAPDQHGNGIGPPENPGNGPPENPGNGKGNGPPENPGNGPPEN